MSDLATQDSTTRVVISAFRALAELAAERDVPFDAAAVRLDDREAWDGNVGAWLTLRGRGETLIMPFLVRGSNEREIRLWIDSAHAVCVDAGGSRVCVPEEPQP